MKGYLANLEHQTETNTDFRRVIFTGKNLQLVLMTLKPGEEIGMEVHDEVDQFFRIEEGQATIIMDGEKGIAGTGDGVIVPAGSEHNVVNEGEVDLKLYTIYAPPNHPDGTVNVTKAEAVEYEKEQHQG